MEVGFACYNYDNYKQFLGGIYVNPYIEEPCPVCHQKRVIIRKGKYVCSNFDCHFSQEVKPRGKKERIKLKADLNDNKHRERWMRRK